VAGAGAPYSAAWAAATATAAHPRQDSGACDGGVVRGLLAELRVYGSSESIAGGGAGGGGEGL